jgi:hypothetical protein
MSTAVVKLRRTLIVESVYAQVSERAKPVPQILELTGIGNP